MFKDAYRVMKLSALSLLFMLLIFFSATESVNAQAVQLNSILQQTLQDDSGKKDIPLPDPLSLSPEWWQYFVVPDFDELSKRVDTFGDVLEQQVAEFDSEKQKDFNSRILHIKANLNAYINLKKLPVPQAQPRSVIQDRYNLSELMAVIHKERDLKTQINRVELDIADQDKQARQLSRQINTAMIAYIESNRYSPNRFDDALSIILTQTEIVLIDERMQLQKKSLANQYLELADVEEHKEIAVKRLEFTEDERNSLKDRIESARADIKEANSRLRREQSQILVTPEETNEDRAVSRYREQRVLKAKIGLASAETKLLIYMNELDSLTLLADDDDLDTTHIQGNINGRARELQELQAKVIDWINQNEVERTLSNQFLADTESKYNDNEHQFLIDLARDRLNLVQETSVLLQKLQTEASDAYFLLNIVEKQLFNYQGIFLNWISKTRNALSNSWRTTKKILNSALFKVGDTPISALNFAQFIIIVLACWWVAYWLNKMLYRIGNKRGDDKLPVYYLIGRLVYYGIILFGFLFALTTVGIDFKNFALVAGALAIGLGFGLQSIVNNFVSGLILLFERSIKVGDFIELQDQLKGRPLWGEVKEINVRATIISDNDNVDIVIPNSEFINTKMLNWTLREPHRRMRYAFKVAYGTDKELVKEAVLEAADEVPHTLKGIPGRNPAVWLTGFQEFCYEFELVVWLTARAVKRPNGVKAAYMWAIDTALRKHNIEIPVPQREHRFREGEVLIVRQEDFDGDSALDLSSAEADLQRDLFEED